MARNVVKEGKLIEFTYRITDTQGNEVENITEPVSNIFKIEGGMHPSIIEILEGCEENGEASTTLPPEQGFGEYDPNLLISDDINNLPEEYHKIGGEIELQTKEGDKKTFYVVDLSDEKITLDGNHPLAGRELEFTVKVLSIRDPSEEELVKARADNQDIDESQIN